MIQILWFDLFEIGSLFSIRKPIFFCLGIDSVESGSIVKQETTAGELYHDRKDYRTMLLFAASLLCLSRL